MSKSAAHPKGIYLVAATEMWERFSYFSIVGLLPLFLTALPREGGFGWSQADAVTLVGLYSGLAFAAPTVGGWISSRYWGARRSIWRGGVLIGLGNGVLVLALCWPDLAYYTQSALFAGGLILTGIGTGLLKPAISSIVDQLYEPADPRRDAGFSLFMLGIWVGAMLSNLISGTLGETFGWHYGFMTAALGMLGGLSAYWACQHRYLGSAGLQPEYREREAAALSTVGRRLSRDEKKKLQALVLLSGFTVLYTTAVYQEFGLLNLAIKNQVERHIWGVEVPATWFLSIGTAVFILMTPVSIRWFASRHERGRPLDVCQKTILALVSLALGYLILTAGWLHQADWGQAKVDMAWVAAGYVLFGIADVLLWPAQIAAASALAPRHLVSFVVGAWYLTFGLGGYLAGVVGAWVVDLPLTHTLPGLCVMLLASAAALAVLRPRLMRWMNSSTDAVPEARVYSN